MEIPFETRRIPAEAHGIAERYANLSRYPDLLEPLQVLLEGVTRIPKFYALSLELMTQTDLYPATLVLTAFRPFLGRKRDRYEINDFMKEYFQLKRSLNNDRDFCVTPMFGFTEIGQTPEEALRRELAHYFEPNPLNLGYHPVDPLADTLPIVTLALVDRTSVDTKTPLHRVSPEVFQTSNIIQSRVTSN